MDMLRTDAVSAEDRLVQQLVEDHVPSRIAAKDSTLYDFDEEVEEFVGRFFGWPKLATEPPIAIEELQAFADEIRAEGLDAVVLIGQGGSTQASMTLTKLNALSNEEVIFKTMDSVSAVYVHKILGECDPARTLYLVSSKSGSTIEPTYLSRVAWYYVSGRLGSEEEAGKRFVAITDPDSDLEEVAKRNKWRAIFYGTPEVGGRFSALSVFGLLPTALVGFDLATLIENAADCERLCASDSPDNPAVVLAAFLYGNYEKGRDKFSLISPQPGRVFGLWVEQLVAESLGKDGEGILPNIEIDASMLALPRADRTAITYAIRPDASFESDISRIHSSIPTIHCEIPTVEQIACHFVMWEYAIAMVATLMEVNPFDQPDVQLTKSKVKEMLASGNSLAKTEGCLQISLEHDLVKEAEISQALYDTAHGACMILDDALEALFASIGKTDYFSVNAFLPFHKEERRIPLEEMRHVAAAHLGVASCLEIGPRYLHSTGQLQKGGPNNGVFLIISSGETEDIVVPTVGTPLGTLAHAQACGDMAALAEKGRRAMRLHLADNDGDTFARVAARVCAAACKVASHPNHH